MRKGRHGTLVCASASMIALAGCASGFGSGMQIAVGAGPSMQVGTSTCSLLGDRTQRLSSTTRLVEFANHQMRMARRSAMNVIPTPQERMESWKRLASGSC